MITIISARGQLMALIKCSDCKREISSQAKVCPHCGCPTQQKTENTEEHNAVIRSYVRSILWMILLILVCWFFGVLAFNDMNF